MLIIYSFVKKVVYIFSVLNLIFLKKGYISIFIPMYFDNCNSCSNGLTTI